MKIIWLQKLEIWRKKISVQGTYLFALLPGKSHFQLLPAESLDFLEGLSGAFDVDAHRCGRHGSVRQNDLKTKVKNQIEKNNEKMIF